MKLLLLIGRTIRPNTYKHHPGDLYARLVAKSSDLRLKRRRNKPLWCWHTLYQTLKRSLGRPISPPTRREEALTEYCGQNTKKWFANTNQRANTKLPKKLAQFIPRSIFYSTSRFYLSPLALLDLDWRPQCIIKTTILVQTIYTTFGTPMDLRFINDSSYALTSTQRF